MNKPEVRSTKFESNSKAEARTSKFMEFDHLDKIGEVALYYGFTPAKSPSVSKADIDAVKDLLEGDYVDDETEKHGHLPLHAEEKLSIIRSYHEADMQSLPQPVMLYYKDPCKNSLRSGGYPRYADLEILGSSGPIAEATLIQAARAMLALEGHMETTVEINSIGDKDALARFSRELTAYYRKNINDMAPVCRELFKSDPFELLGSRIPEAAELNAGAPRALDFLTEGSRRNLEEVLEYLETLGIPYAVNNGLLGNRKYNTETIFAIVESNSSEKKTQRILAIGARYSGLGKRLNLKRDIPGVGISILVKEGKNGLRKPVTKVKRPFASFVQLGLESKLLSLGVIEQLRQVKIPLYLSLSKDRLGAQVSTVERYHTPYVIVMGKKEAVEKTVIVRRNDTHAQDIVPLEELPKYMKKVEDQLGKK